MSQTENLPDLHKLTPAPPMGWNSYDSYGCSASERTLLANAEAMAIRLKPYGYEYFVVDNGWFGEYEIAAGQLYPTVKHAQDVHIDEYGRYQPSACYFPNGLKPVIDRVHELGLKFGIHIMRGIPRKAVELNVPIYGTSYRASDVADIQDTCKWCPYNYGVDMDKPGAQEFYDSLVSQLAAWGVDFIKADDITGFPREIEAIVRAIGNSGRNMALSLSPGGDTSPDRMATYRHANMLRTTTDIWDNRNDLNKAFEAWEKYHRVQIEGLWLDMDMIPFGHLQLWNSRDRIGAFPDDGNNELSGKGHERMSGLSRSQKYTFITMRALAASPLFMGGDLLTSDEFSFSLITNRDMIACNQNGVMGSLVYRAGDIDVWKTPSRDVNSSGWIGLFNRSAEAAHLELSLRDMQIDEDASKCTFRQIWSEPDWSLTDGVLRASISGDGVLFLAYENA